MEARIIGVMKFDDGGEVDDKVIAVLADDKRMNHILSFEEPWRALVKRNKVLLGALQRSKKTRNMYCQWFFWDRRSC